MNLKTLRILIPLAVLLLAGVGFVAHVGIGDLSAIGWSSISVLCPLGALGTMLASKTLVPHAVISLIIAIVAIFLLGRAFCGWICPVPVVSKLRTAFSRPESAKKADVDAAAEDSDKAEGAAKPLSAKEKAMLKGACHNHVCKPEDRPNNSRNLVLGGALLSAAIFGFPVFCLICPIGLTFALVFVLIALFGSGDVTWSVVAIPVLLAVEVVFFRKWCSHICPLSALMSLIGKVNRTFRPQVNEEKCVENTKGATCGKCAQVCEQGIDPRHPELGSSWSECTRCGECIKVCPGNAIKLAVLVSNNSGGSKPQKELVAAADMETQTEAVKAQAEKAEAAPAQAEAAPAQAAKAEASTPASEA